MLSNLSELQTFTLFHREEFSKECISNISEVLLAKDHGNTHLIKSRKSTLDGFQPILLIYKSGRLMWSLVGKNNPSKTLYLKYCQTKREIYWITETSQKGHWKIMLERGKDETHTFR